jgi:hypothetical protein
MTNIVSLAEYRERKRLERERGRNALRRLLFPDLFPEDRPDTA